METVLWVVGTIAGILLVGWLAVKWQRFKFHWNNQAGPVLPPRKRPRK